MNSYGTARKPLLDEVVERVRFDIGDDSRDLPSLAIRPQDRVHVDICHVAPKLQVCVRERQERARGRSRPHGLSSRPCRLLQVPDGRHDHCQPQTSIVTPLRRRSVASLAHRVTVKGDRPVGVTGPYVPDTIEANGTVKPAIADGTRPGPKRAFDRY